MADIIGGEVVTELVKHLFAISKKAYKCRGIAERLATMVGDIQPTIKEIQYSGVELTPHRQFQLRMFSETLDKCRKLTEKVLKCSRWNMFRQLIHVRKMEDLEKKISTFLTGQLLAHVLADVHRVLADSDVRFDRIDSTCDSLNEKLGSMKLRGSDSMRDAMMTNEPTADMVADGDLGKRAVKDMLFNSTDEASRLIGISGMSGSGKTTLAKELARDEDVRGYFGNQILFLIVSQSPNFVYFPAIAKTKCYINMYVLPPFIAKMGRLRALVIINNGLSPAHLHDFSIFTNLAKLRNLWLERVHVPELSRSTVPMKNLHKLSLIQCKINNSFDQTAVDIAQIFPNLSDLTIDHCSDLVELSSTICEITSLNSISITNCPRIKELPKNLSKLKALQLLRLYACPELRSLPVEICELPRLKYLDISQCVSMSSLPEEMGKLRTLEKMDMRECSLSSIPSSAVSLTSLRHVICDRETLWMWEEVEKAVPGLRVEAAEKSFSLDWLHE